MKYELLEDLINCRLDNKEIKEKYNISFSYISHLRKNIMNLKYKPIFKEGKLVCTRCKENRVHLGIHHVHQTGELIAIVCQSCNLLLKQSAIIDIPSFEKEKYTITINDENLIWLKEIRNQLIKPGQYPPTYDDVLKEIKHWFEVGKNVK